jgi:osmotically-inducible protein OsmY
VLHVVRSPVISEASAEAIRALATMALANRAEAALSEATVGRGFVPAVSVSVMEPGKVRVSGQVETEGQKANAENVLRTVKGVEAIENVIQVVPPFRTGV